MSTEYTAIRNCTNPTHSAAFCQWNPRLRISVWNIVWTRHKRFWGLQEGREEGGGAKQSLRLPRPPHQVRGLRNDRFGSVEPNYFMLPLMIIVVVFFWSYISPNWDEAPKTVLDNLPPYTIDFRRGAWNLQRSNPVLFWRPGVILFPFSKGFPNVSIPGSVRGFLLKRIG